MLYENREQNLVSQTTTVVAADPWDISRTISIIRFFKTTFDLINPGTLNEPFGRVNRLPTHARHTRCVLVSSSETRLAVSGRCRSIDLFSTSIYAHQIFTRGRRSFFSPSYSHPSTLFTVLLRMNRKIPKSNRQVDWWARVFSSHVRVPRKPTAGLRARSLATNPPKSPKACLLSIVTVRTGSLLTCRSKYWLFLNIYLSHTLLPAIIWTRSRGG